MMAHRSNQAVTSQERTPAAPAEPPPPRRYLIGWATAFAALTVSTTLVAAGVWLARIPLAKFMIGAALSERGAEADFDVLSLDIHSIVLANIRFGAESSPDAAISAVEARWRWRGFAPQLDRVRLMEPRLRLRLDRGGRVSAGALDNISGGPPGARRPTVPRIELEVVDGGVLIEAPFGALEGAFEATGRIGEDFSAVGRIAETSRPGQAYALERGGAELVILSRQDTLAFRLAAQARGLAWNGARAEEAQLVATGRAPLDLARIDAEAALRLASLDAESVTASRVAVTFRGDAQTREDALALTDWTAQARAQAASLSFNDIAMQDARAEADAEGAGAQGRGRWSAGGARFAGLGMISQQPAASGRFFIDDARRVSGDALLTLTRTSLDADAQQTLRSALPDLDGTPLGPTFAQARSALDRAADSFTLSAPLLIGADPQGPRLTVTAPVEVRAASGARLRLSPLRRDAPALVLQWPGPRLTGAVALELTGGGAPDATLLFDTVTASAEVPFEADGTLTLQNWRAENASIAADEIGVTVAAAPGGRGRLDLRGPARITGPIGDGQVRDLAPTLDVAISWGDGWRVATNSGCLPVRMGGLDAAGLSFANGDFALCPLEGALIAADRARNLSGGFSIQRLALHGRMAGPQAQPARVGAHNVVGRFRGRSDDMTLALVADAPTLTIDMAEDRTLALQMSQITANAHIADSWRIDGGFTSGTLEDPTLPGAVSAIEGAWSAAPEDGQAVIRVTAAEALLTAHRPASENERPLFNPLRLVDVNALLRDGDVAAAGAILLDARDRQLASFTARHDMDVGQGAAEITAPLVFGPNLQPYDITEQARGLVESVSGAADVVADIAWTRDAIASTGRMRLNGVSLATATIPIIENANGEIVFDDLFALTTPPGQELSIGLLNPGVAVTNGRVRFQLLAEQRVNIEHAEFDFASGVLAMEPAEITLGADETRFELTLHDVDASRLLAELQLPDLQATGLLAGSFPLLLTRRSAYVERGIVRAQGEGGTISYTGNAGAGADGISRIAFDALRGFRYDALSLTLDGDLNGEVVSSIEFTGRNTGRPVDLGPVAPVPGLGRVSVRGVPFVFHVRVTAPFRRLAQTAATIANPGSLLNQSRNGDEQEPVDRRPPGSE